MTCFRHSLETGSGDQANCEGDQVSKLGLRSASSMMITAKAITLDASENAISLILCFLCSIFESS
jgi:hypothetical protein